MRNITMVVIRALRETFVNTGKKLQSIKGAAMSAVRMFIPEERMRLMTGIRQATSTHNCPDCKRPTYCAMEDGKSSTLCWCMTVTKTTNVSSDPDTCLCRDCLTGQNL